MRSDRLAAIVGVAEAELVEGKVLPGKSVLASQAEVAIAALAEAGLTLNDVDALYTAGMWGMGGGFGPGMMQSMVLAEYLGIQPKVTDSTNTGGSAFEVHVGHAVDAIRAGRCEVALIVYGSHQRSERSRSQGGRPPILNYQYELPYGLPFPLGAYALAATRHMHLYGTTSEQLAEIAVATRKWAMLNPRARMRDPLTIDDVLSSPMISDPLHLLDCCLVTDGAGAVVVVSPERARDVATKPVWVLGHTETHTHHVISQMPDLTQLGGALHGRKAIEMAGIRHEDIDVVEIYDSFTITVLLTLEGLGFCGRGEGGDFVSNQRTAPGGEFPLNTNGGGLSYCHPGMYGIFLLIEATRQLRGECGERQVPNARIALAHGTGGTLSSGATVVLGRD